MTHYVLPETDARPDYDKKTRAVYVSVSGPLAEGAVSSTVAVNFEPLVHLDYDAGGKLLGVEVLLP